MSSSKTETRVAKSARSGKGSRRKPVVEEQPWQLTCLCGRRLSGLRTENEQVVTCEHCDRQHFVLPANPYPPPQRKRKRKLRPQDAGAVWKTVARGVGGFLLLLPRLLRYLVVGLGKFILARLKAFRYWFTPLRIAILSLSFVVLLGGMLAYRQQRSRQAVRTLRDAVQLAETAEAEADWSRATTEYARAAEAVRILSRQDEFAREILEKDREYQAVGNLCPLSLTDLIEEASGTRQVGGSWDVTFRQSVENRWLVVESWLQPALAAGDEDWLQLAQPLMIAGQQVQLRWPARLVQGISPSERSAMHLLCAGQIQSVARTADASPHWQITLVPETAFLWRHPETCAAIGFEVESPWMPELSLKAVLARQRQLESGLAP